MAVLLGCSPHTLATGTLNPTFGTVPGGTIINLTAAGSVDWVHWGLYTDTSLDRKAGVTSQISNFIPLYNTGDSNAYVFVYQYSDNPNGYSWNDGNPNAIVTNTTTGVWAYGLPQIGTGFEISVPADTTVRTLKVYVGVFAAVGRFVAFLSDGSAPSYTNSSLDSIRTTQNGVYSLEYSANSAGQTLTIRWTLELFHDPSGNVTLQSAALTATNANNPPFVSITSPTENATFTAGTNLTIKGDASDLDGSIAKVEFYDGNTKLGTVNSSPYNFAWNNVPSGYHVLTAVATDNNADFSSSMPVEIFVNGTGGILSASSTMPPSSLDLTLEGTADWAHWGLITNSSFDHKASVPQQISNFSVFGTNPVTQFADNFTAYSWSDGTPTPSATNTATGVFITGITNGFQLHAPADTSSRRLKVYVGLYGVQGNFQAYLSDSSAKAFTDTSLSNVFDNSYAVYTLDYAAASAGQSLIIQYRSLTLYDQQFGNVTLQAATLVGTNSGPADIPPTVSISTPTNGSSFVAPANITIVAAASDSDGTITNLELFNRTTKLGQSTNSTFTFTWTNVASGAYSLTAIATDNLGAATTSSSVDITVITSTNMLLRYQLFTTNGSLGLSIFPTVAQPYALDASSNLINWASIFTNQTGDAASNFTLAPLTNPPDRFFRGRRWP
jgi:hypothetical protein